MHVLREYEEKEKTLRDIVWILGRLRSTCCVSPLDGIITHLRQNTIVHERGKKMFIRDLKIDHHHHHHHSSGSIAFLHHSCSHLLEFVKRLHGWCVVVPSHNFS